MHPRDIDWLSVRFLSQHYIRQTGGKETSEKGRGYKTDNKAPILTDVRVRSRDAVIDCPMRWGLHEMCELKAILGVEVAVVSVC
jgi:hypothetical protein